MSAGISTFSFSAILALAAVSAFAQAPKVKTADTVRSKYLPTGVRLGTDLISLVKNRATTTFKGWETNADLDFYRYYLTLDYGRWARHDSIKAVTASSGKGLYQNQGNYFRLGVDINFLLKDPDKNMFFIGFRYGHSLFHQSLDYSYYSPFYGTSSKSLSSTGLAGSWLELTSGLRVKIVSGFWMGYTARLKFGAGVKGNSSTLNTYDIPGYGTTGLGKYWGFNYQVFWRFPVAKTK